MLTIRIIPKMRESPPARRKRSAPYEMPLNACVIQNSTVLFIIRKGGRCTGRKSAADGAYGCPIH